MDDAQGHPSQYPDSVITKVIKEKISRKILRSLMGNFSSAAEALSELVDNAFDEFDGAQGGNCLTVNLEVRRNKIVVENIGGKGMGPDELQKWLSWGEPSQIDGIREYGQGGKAAMGYLGKAWVVITKRWDQPSFWSIKEDNWKDFSSEEKTYAAENIGENYRSLKYKDLGYCRFEIKNLEKRRQEITRLRNTLSNVYRTFLQEGKAIITLDGEPLPPLELPEYEGFKRQEFKIQTNQGWWIKGWIGRLKRDSRVHGGTKVSGGMRLLRKGRLICDGEYFGHHNFLYKASLGMLIGEVELTKKVPVLPNKTNFQRDSPEWDEVQRAMYEVLKPHIRALLEQSEEETVTREEKKRVNWVREMMIEALKRISTQPETQSMLGELQGRKPPEKTEEVKPPTSEEREEAHERKPRTPPPEGAIGRLKRLGRMPEWEPRDLSPEIRSAWEEQDGSRKLLINNNYCLYKDRKGDELYIAETAALQLAKPAEEEAKTLGGYLEEVNTIMRAFCEVWDAKT